MPHLYQVYLLKKAEMVPEGLDVATYALHSAMQSIVTEHLGKVPTGLSTSEDFSYPRADLRTSVLESYQKGMRPINKGVHDLGIVMQGPQSIEDEFAKLYCNRTPIETMAQAATTEIQAMGSKDLLQRYVRESLKEIVTVKTKEQEERILTEFKSEYDQGNIPAGVPNMEYLKQYRTIEKQGVKRIHDEIVRDIKEAKKNTIEKAVRNILRQHAPFYFTARNCLQNGQKYAIARLTIHDEQKLVAIEDQAHKRALSYLSIKMEDLDSY